MPRPNSSFLLCIIAIGLAGCPSEETDQMMTTTMRDAGMMPTNETTGAMLARIVCERQQACCPGNTSSCETLGSVLDARFEGEGVVVDEAGVATCVAAMQNADCATVAQYGGRLPVGRFCSNLSTGSLPNGSTCGGLFGDEQCASGHCIDGTCSAALQEMADCTAGDCGAGLRCHLGTCVTPTAAGASCEQRSVCEDGYACYRLMGEMEARCHAEVVIQPGESCDQGTVCSLGAEECRCPVDMTGCSVGLCGNASRCLP